jgi:hypothetical protein
MSSRAPWAEFENVVARLQRTFIYGLRSKLIVVFLDASYAEKEWCGIEFRAVKEIIKARNDTMVMFVRTDQAKAPGVFSTDGYVDATTHSPAEMAALILERFRLNQLAS